MSMKSAILLSAALLFAIVMAGILYSRSRPDPTPEQEAVREVRVFLNTIRTDRWPNAYMVLAEEVRQRVSEDAFRAAVEAHPALADFETFEPASFDDLLEVHGTLRGANAEHDLVVRYGADGSHVVEIVIDGNDVLGG